METVAAVLRDEFSAMKSAWIIPFTFAACSPSEGGADATANPVSDAAIDAGIDAGMPAADAGTDCATTMPPTTLYQDYCMIGELEMCLYDVNRGPR
jgi:hypothetical protein